MNPAPPVTSALTRLPYSTMAGLATLLSYHSTVRVSLSLEPAAWSLARPKPCRTRPLPLRLADLALTAHDPALDALEMALWQRRGDPEGLVHYSDSEQ